LECWVKFGIVASVTWKKWPQNSNGKEIWRQNERLSID
jgi:hypothetical protein